MVLSLTNRERAHLKARAHALEPVVQVGLAGLTDKVGVVLDVAQDDAERAVAAARSGDVDLVRLGG